MDLALLAKTRQEYKSNKVRKQERWFDWTPPGQGDALDELVVHQRARRSPDPVPFDVFKKDDGVCAPPFGATCHLAALLLTCVSFFSGRTRLTTPYNKRVEMDKDGDAAKEMFAANRVTAEICSKRK